MRGQTLFRIQHFIHALGTYSLYNSSFKAQLTHTCHTMLMMDSGLKGTIQDIALKLAEQQLKEKAMASVELASRERTIFVLGSKEVVSEFFACT